jgi:RimJ/RimL family protein N-acetyltransferase
MARMPVTIEADAAGVRLERWAEAHADGAWRALRSSIDEVGAWLTSWSAIRTRSQLLLSIELERARFDADESYEYFVLDGADVVGACGVGFEDDVASLGYWVRTSCAGRGIATAAAAALGRTVLEQCSVSALQIETDRGNEASAAVARRLGYTLVGERSFTPVAPAHTGVELVWRLERP